VSSPAAPASSWPGKKRFAMNERGHLSAETIDLLMLSSLAAGDAAKARDHISSCDKCKARWTELEEDKARFDQFVFPRTVAAVEKRANRSVLDFVRERWAMLVPALGVAVAATLLIVVSVKGSQTEDEPYYGVKGGKASVEVVANRVGKGNFDVKEGAVLHPKDRIQFVVDSAGMKYVLIASKDGKGNVSIYFPYEGKQSAEVAPGKHVLPGSIELDDVVGREKLVTVFSDAPVEADAVKKSIESGAPVEAAKVQTLEFDKVAE
jgi:hypothetical protein